MREGEWSEKDCSAQISGTDSAGIDLRGAIESWRGSPYVLNRKGKPYTPERFRSTWADLMERTPAGRIRKEG